MGELILAHEGTLERAPGYSAPLAWRRAEVIRNQSEEAPMDVLLAVNGTLMRGLELNANLLAIGARFVREARTAPVYRLWSIDDRHPAMMRVGRGGAAVEVEVWSVPAEGLASVLLQEPPGLAIGKVVLEDRLETFGVLGESILCEGMREITAYGGWRAYTAARGSQPPSG